MFSKLALLFIEQHTKEHLDIRNKSADWFIIFNYQGNLEFSFELDGSYEEYNQWEIYKKIDHKTAYKMWLLMGKPEWI